MCFYTFKKPDENDAIYDIHDEGDSTAEIKERDDRKWGLTFYMRT